MARRGPKTRPGKREKNGQLTRNPKVLSDRRKQAFDREAMETMSVGLEARQRVHGISEEMAKDPLSGTVIGRMRKSNTLSVPQYDAAQKFITLTTAYRHAISAPREPGAVDLNRVHGLPSRSDEGWTEWAQKTKAKHAVMSDAIGAAQQVHGNTANLWSALDQFCMRDCYISNLEGDLRIALNCLVRHFGLVGIDAA